ncbi:hypothetical protein ACJX0J_021304, partial [Zea mays]
LSMGARYLSSIIRNEETETSECFYKQHEEIVPSLPHQTFSCTPLQEAPSLKDASENLVKGQICTAQGAQIHKNLGLKVVAQREKLFLRERGPSVVAAPRGHDYQLNLTIF